MPLARTTTSPARESDVLAAPVAETTRTDARSGPASTRVTTSANAPSATRSPAARMRSPPMRELLSAAGGSELNVLPHRHRPLRRQAEVLDGTRGQPRQAQEQALAPVGHALRVRADDRDVGDEVRGAAHVEVALLDDLVGVAQQRGHVRVVLEADLRSHMGDPVVPVT